MIHVGRWEEDRPSGMGARFDAKGNLLYSGKWEEGRRQGAGITYRAEDGSIFIGQWKDDALTGLGSEFGADGSLLYTGYWKHCRRDGTRHRVRPRREDCLYRSVPGRPLSRRGDPLFPRRPPHSGLLL